VLPQVETARQQWEEGHRRLQAAAGDPARYERLTAQVDALTDELRRRIGQLFTLRELTEEYGRAERWAREAVADVVPRPRPGDLSIAEDAAFHLYARGARDFIP
jgi:alcohol dehydrogenase class IV